MDNRDMPADPVNKEYIHPETRQSVHEMYNGLTKREYIAAMAMQGILSNPNCEPIYQREYDDIAKESIRVSNTLLKQLEGSE